jgi:uncharacterized membrane protein
MPWYLLALGSAVFFGLYQVSEKKALTKEHSLVFLLASSLLMLAISLPMAFLGYVETVSFELLFYIFIKCLFAVIFFLFCAKALRHMDVSEFSPLLNLNILLLFVPAVLFLGERPGMINFLGAILIVLGAYLVELKDGWKLHLKKTLKNKYIHFVMFALVFGALAATMDKFVLARSVDVNTFFFFNRLFIAILLLFAYFNSRSIKGGVRIAYKRSFWWILAAAILFMGADYLYFSAVAVPVALIALVIPLKRMGTLVATVVGGEIMKEDRLLRKSVACLVMIAGATLIVI